MKKHAVPQNIMDIEFKLFGNLTVKQFSYVSITLFFALGIYILDIPDIVGVPIIVTVILLGLSVTFLKVNGAPFSTWFGHFISNLFSSQRKVYKKNSPTPEILKTSTRPTITNSKVKTPLQTKNSRYIQALFNEEKEDDENDNKIQPSVVEETNVEDILSSRRALELEKYFNKTAQQSLNRYSIPTIDNGIAGQTPPLNQEVASLDGKVVIETLKNTDTRPLNKSANIPTTIPRAVGNTQRIDLLIEDTLPVAINTNTILIKQDPQNNQNTSAIPSQTVPVTTKNQDALDAVGTENREVKVLKKLQPNQVSGFAVDKNNMPIANVSISILDTQHNLLRVVYSDNNGKFIFPSTLPNGIYQLELKHDKHSFPVYNLELKGEVIPLYKYLAS